MTPRAEWPNKGNVVELMSGGPPMTVVGIVAGSDTLYVNCVWFADTELKTESFPALALKSHPSDPRVP